MVKYYCDRCGKTRGRVELFTVTVTPPEVWDYNDSLIMYFDGNLHFCRECMKKINDCIDELGRSDG